MRLYFHLVNDTGIVRDPDGIDVDSIDHALAASLRALDEIRGEELAAGADWSGWTLNITDVSGRTLFTVDLDRTIQ